MRIRKLIVFNLLLALALLFFVPARPVPLVLNACVAKETFVEGEPIEVKIEIANPNKQPVYVVFDYPTFDMTGPNFRFALDGGVFQGYDWPCRLPQYGAVSFFPPYRRIDGRGRFQFSVFLQAYVGQPAPGRHHVRYAIDLGRAPFDKLGPASSPSVPVNASGSLSFRIASARPGLLSRLVDTRLVGLAGAETEQQNQVFEYIRLVKEPVAVTKLIGAIREKNNEIQLLEALSYLRDREDARDARDAILEAFLSASPRAMAQAIGIVSSWDVHLKPHVLAEMQKVDDQEVRDALDVYLKTHRLVDGKARSRR